MMNHKYYQELDFDVSEEWIQFPRAKLSVQHLGMAKKGNFCT